MQLETQAQLDRLAKASPRAIARLERMRRARKTRLSREEIDDAIEQARAILRAEQKPRELKARESGRRSQKQDRTAQIEAQRARSYTAEADDANPARAKRLARQRAWRKNNPDRASGPSKKVRF